MSDWPHGMTVYHAQDTDGCFDSGRGRRRPWVGEHVRGVEANPGALFE